MISSRIACLAAALLATAALAQVDPAPTGTSKPQPLPIVDTIPPAKDVPYPGQLAIRVDATDLAHGVFRMTETIPVAGGPLVLLAPKWLPGDHAPTGQMDKLAGFIFTTADGKTIPWRRDPVDVYALHLDVPAGTTSITAQYEFLSPTAENQGRVVMTPQMLNVQWTAVALYPAGHFVRQIMIQPTVLYPQGWTAATALRPAGAPGADGAITYNPVAFDTLVDSPIFAGKYSLREQLSPRVTLNVFADSPSMLKVDPKVIAIHHRIVEQATKLYGAQHYDHYDYLLALTDRLGDIGLEHHRSSENAHPTDYFTKWDDNPAGRDLLTHEYTHSWNGKFRRPADLWTPDYRMPMRDSLLWVYEGQTQFWGNVLAVRSGLMSRDEGYDALAATAASYENLAGRQWRPLADTTSDEIINPRRPQAFRSYQRFEDYYSEGQLIWLEADSIIREKSGGKRSLDDFARAFFGVRDGDWGELTYDVDEVVKTLNAVQPYDWATFLHDRVDTIRPHAPLEGISRGGYTLVYTDKPGTWWKSNETNRHIVDLTYSLGLVMGKDGAVAAVQWGGPAFKAGIAPGTKIVAIDGQAYSDDDLKTAITNAKGGTAPIKLLIRQDDGYRTVDVVWNGGLRYPHLERTGKGPSSLDALYAARK